MKKTVTKNVWFKTIILESKDTLSFYEIKMSMVQGH
jgi:hypothetical protein